MICVGGGVVLDAECLAGATRPSGLRVELVAGGAIGTGVGALAPRLLEEMPRVEVRPGRSKLELTVYHTPAAVGAEPENPPPNTLGLHRVMFAIDDTVDRLRDHGAELLGEVA